MGEKYSLENDHIFPWSLLKKNGYDWNNRHKYRLAQEITNRALLAQTANRSKSDTLPVDYLSHVLEQHPQALKDQCIPEDINLWTIEQYEQFLHARRIKLTNELNEFLS
jgi:hypothetical protein